MSNTPRSPGDSRSKPHEGAEPPRKSLSMHEGKAIWCDCCSCEAEERWAELAEEMGIDLSDDEPEGDASKQ
jgi:hypothetical protein